MTTAKKPPRAILEAKPRLVSRGATTESSAIKEAKTTASSPVTPKPPRANGSAKPKLCSRGATTVSSASDRPVPNADTLTTHKPPRAIRSTKPTDLPRGATIAASQRRSASHTGRAGGNSSGAVHLTADNQTPRDRSGWLFLRVAAEMYEDVQKARIACENRSLRAALDPAMYNAQLETLRVAEHEFALELGRCYRRVVPEEIRQWQSESYLIGAHTLARLLGVIGHPVNTVVHTWEGTGERRRLVVIGEKQRRVSDLWSYCGHGDPSRKRRKGMSAEDGAALGNPRAKMLTYLLATATTKEPGRSVEKLWTGEQTPDECRGKYRAVYEEARLKYRDRDVSDGHQQAMALRLVGKEILRDLWMASHGRT